ncbi:3-(3-hydroxy-phenyl)propionate transporter MhpT [Ectopseudomonas guguanensis]|uniref:MFS transporter, AAHS family, 3-hydroxyphenylpropionic acid transporter n=1 Tax=Ectopseudomonas guguanensis TaxID=1198456 RepID=A0A1H0XHS6_9GAMM|nr:3-(3-hydroxy-phenyl)propionate transporter MhpT [Pseudomonas guguanensis]SDQ02492.1 MFS transporter, AAHS family, 3-hydroxyphenylpropionic acid transporter [Pseudomonas guguanensis]
MNALTETLHGQSRMAATIGLCFLVALLEGLDLQAAGIAASGMATAFSLDKMQMGWVFSAGILGLLPGAFAGGWLADRIGRKRVLIASVALFGLFSLATAYAWDLSTLIAARLLTGVGLGAALPNLIALTSEAAGTRLRGSAVSLMYCGVPLGAALAAAIGIAGYAADWQLVFQIGGVVPLLILPLLWMYLPETSDFRTASIRSNPTNLRTDLLGQSATWLLWLSYFFTLMVVYILINWLPSLLVNQGFSSINASWVMFALQIGAAIGTLALGVLMEHLPAWATAALVYVGILCALAGLGLAEDLTGMLVAGFVAGFFATGGQGVLYALAPWFYPARVRATGVGAAVAVGRLGAMSGPLVAGQMLALGTGTAGVLLASAPGIVVAALALFHLGMRRPARLPD